MQARIMWRIGVANVQTKMALLFVVELIIPAALFIAYTVTDNPVLVIAAGIMLQLPSALVNISLCLMVRDRYGIPSDCCNDCIFPLLCTACSLAQLDHETAPKLEAAAAAAALINGAAKSAATEQTRLT